MPLDTTLAGASADSYDTLANGLAYLIDRGYAGSIVQRAVTVSGAVAADGETVTLAGASEGDTVLAGDGFQVAGAPGDYSFPRAVTAGSGGSLTDVPFSPATPEGFADTAAVTWLALDDERARRATILLDARYRGRLKGYRTTRTQALLWPRYSVDDGEFSVDADAIPVAVRHAQWEMSRLAASTMQYDEETMIAAVSAEGAGVDFVGGARTRGILDLVDALMRQFTERRQRFY